MAVPMWLQLVLRFAPIVLGLIPATAPIAGVVAEGIAAAEALPGATGPDKKAYVMQLAATAVTGVNATGGRVDPAMTLAAASSAIDTVVAVVNTIHDAHGAALVTGTSGYSSTPTS